MTCCLSHSQSRWVGQGECLFYAEVKREGLCVSWRCPSCVHYSWDFALFTFCLFACAPNCLFCQLPLQPTNPPQQETLTYAALLRLPGSMSKKQKLDRVDTVLEALGLGKSKDTIIGEVCERTLKLRREKADRGND